jgi:hypothetical protein
VKWPRGDGVGPAIDTAKTRADFAADEYSDTVGLRKAMRGALVAERLFGDEADAMLNTWELSYFKSPGTRLFFIVPRAWTERVLPLTIKREGNALPPERIVRAMVGRIELLTPEHRALLNAIAHPPAGLSGKERLKAQLDAYRDLGRFRDAIILLATRSSTEYFQELIASQQISSFETR